MSKSTVVITLGRDVDGVPMNALNWAAFGWETIDALEDAAATIVQRPRMNGQPDQLGIWEGKQEDAVAFVALVEDVAIPRLKEQVRKLRRYFGQEAAGFIVASGTENLV